MDWRNSENRQRVCEQIEQQNKGINVAEIENQAYENSSNQKEYLGFMMNKISEITAKQRNDKIVQSQQRHAQLISQRGNLVSGSPAFIDGTASSLHANGNQQSNLIQQQLIQQQLQQGMRAQQPADPINALQHLTKQGLQAVPGQQPGQVIRQPNQMTSVIQQRMQFHGYSGPGGPRNVAQQVRGDMIMMQSQPSRLQMMNQQGQIMPQGQFVGNSMQTQFHLAAQPRGQHISQIQSFNQQVAGSPVNLQSSGGSQQSLVSHMQPSPALAGSGMMIPSPSNLNIPSQSPAMQPHLVGLSPSSRMSLSSPGSHLSTPGNPGSVSIGGGQMSALEEQEYLQKWEHLQKYLDLLKKMISKIDKEEDKKMDLNKMKNLLDILSDRSKRVTLSALSRCEAVLEKQLQITCDAVTSSANMSSAAGGDGLIFGQDLFDCINAHKNSPYFKHILAQTFGFIKNFAHEPEYDEPEVEIVQPSQGNGGLLELHEILPMEMAKLSKKFVLNFDDSHVVGSETKVLLCRLADEDLPAVPSLVVHLPKEYPMASPIAIMDKDVYGSCELFQKIYDGFQYELDQYLGSHSLMSLLHLW